MSKIKQLKELLSDSELENKTVSKVSDNHNSKQQSIDNSKYIKNNIQTNPTGNS